MSPKTGLFNLCSQRVQAPAAVLCFALVFLLPILFAAAGQPVRISSFLQGIRCRPWRQGVPSKTWRSIAGVPLSVVHWDRLDLTEPAWTR